MSRFAALVSLSLAFAAFHQTADAKAATRTFKAVADAYVAEANPAKNYGSATRVYVKSGKHADVTFARFYVAGLAGTITRAELRFYSTGAITNGPAVYRTFASWSERSITWRTRPGALTGTRNDKGALGGGSWVTWDVTPWVTGDGAYGFALKGGSSNAAAAFTSQTETA